MTLYCAFCGGGLRPVAITAAGSTEACPCGRTTLTRLAGGKLDLGVVTPTDPPVELEREGEDPTRVGA